MRAKITLGLGALAVGLVMAAAPVFAQSGPYYPSDRKLNDNGSVYEPGPASTAKQPAGPLYNYVPPQAGHGQYFTSDRKLNDNGSVDEPRSQ